MKISALMKELYRVKCEHGDIEVTCTGSNLPDNHGGVIPDVFETSAENLIVKSSPSVFGEKRVRIYL